MTTIYTYWLLTLKYLDDKSINNLSIVNKYYRRLTKEKRLLNYGKYMGWEGLCKIGNFDAIKILYKYRVFVMKIYFDFAFIDIASQYGHLQIVKFLHMNELEIKKIFPYLMKYGTYCTNNAMDWAARNGCLNIVKFLHENRKEGCSVFAMYWAAKNGHLEIVKYLHENRKEGCTEWAMNIASQRGHLEVIKWLHNNIKWNKKELSNVLEISIKYKQKEVAEWLIKNKYEITYYVINMAMENGYEELAIKMSKIKKNRETISFYIYDDD